MSAAHSRDSLKLGCTWGDAAGGHRNGKMSVKIREGDVIYYTVTPQYPRVLGAG